MPALTRYPCNEEKRLGWWRAAVTAALAIASVQASACSQPIANQIVISSRNQILWNGTAIDRPTLIRYFQIMDRMNPLPNTYFDYQAGANCGVVNNTARSIVLNRSERIVFGRDGEVARGKGCSIPLRRVDTRGGICGPGGPLFFLRAR